MAAASFVHERLLVHHQHVTNEIEAYLADPTERPTIPPTPERKAQLLADLAAEQPRARHDALLNLAAWEPDPEVAEGLRPLLESDDIYEAGQAAIGLAHQGDVTDLPALVALVHRLSPADGGTVDSMLLPLRAALRLAALAGPDIVEGLKVRARQWRVDPRARPKIPDRELDQQLDALLADE
jgi:hypothetical protein